MRSSPAFLVAIAGPLASLAAQTPRALTADDYTRAERFLGTHTASRVTGLGVRPTWLPDGRFWYRTTIASGWQFVLIDPASGPGSMPSISGVSRRR